MDNEDIRTPLRKAVDWLISNGRIKYDKDLEEIFKLKKNTISTYITGVPGKRFKREFEDYFKISLEQFEENKNPEMTMTDLSGYVIESHVMLKVILGVMAEIKAEQIKGSSTTIAAGLQQTVNQLLKKEVGET